jgi:hypothetical protein
MVMLRASASALDSRSAQSRLGIVSPIRGYIHKKKPQRSKKSSSTAGDDATEQEDQPQQVQ